MKTQSTMESKAGCFFRGSNGSFLVKDVNPPRSMVSTLFLEQSSREVHFFASAGFVEQRKRRKKRMLKDP